MEEKIKGKMLKDQIGREGVHGYKAEMYKAGRTYEMNKSLFDVFLKMGVIEKAKGNPKVEPTKSKMTGPKENK
jgi:hypothetical protein